MKCIHCGGEMKPGTIPFHIDRKDCHFTLGKVPAWVCGQGGEAYFDEKEVIAIENLIEALEDKADALCAAG